MGYSRQIFALARAGFLPQALAGVHPRWQTPHFAILAGGAIGIAAIYSDNLRRRSRRPAPDREHRHDVGLRRDRDVHHQPAEPAAFAAPEPAWKGRFVPRYPLFPLIALAIAAVSLLAIVYYNPAVAALFAALGILGAPDATAPAFRNGHRA